MPTLTGPGDTREDERGKELAEKSTSRDQHGAKPLDPGEQSSLDQMEAGLKNGDSAAEPKKDDIGSGPSKSSGGNSGNPLGRMAKGGLNFMGSHKKAMGIGGGLAGAIIATILLFLALLPLKIESMMKNIFEKRVGQYAERSIQARETLLIDTYLAKSLQAGAEGDAAADTEFKKLIVTSGKPVQDFYKTLRVNKFAANLQKDQGIQLRKGAKFGTVDINRNGTWENLGSSDARDAMNKAVESETKWNQWYKRHHLRVWMRNALGIQKWKSFSGESGEDKATTEVRGELVDAAAAEDAEKFPKVLDCAFGGSCDENNQGHDSSEDSDVKSAVSGAEQQAGDAVKNANPKLSAKALQALFGKELGKQIGDTLTKVSGTLAILGLVDIASRIDHFFATGNADKAIVGLHQAEYAAQFTEWLTISDQIKDGTAPGDKKVTGDEVNAIMLQTDDPAKSAGFQQVYLGKSGAGGQGLTTRNDGSTSVVGRTVNEQGTPVKDGYEAYIGNIGVGSLDVHHVLDVWYSDGGRQVMDLVGAAGGFVLSAAEHLVPGLGALMKAIQTMLADMFVKLIPPAVSGVETGADLFNNLDAGATVIESQFMKSIGGVVTSVSETDSINQQIASDQSAQAAKLSFADRLFSPDYDHSMVNTLAVMVPSSPSGAASQAGGYLASMFANPFKWFGQVFATIPTPFNNFASAADQPNLYGIQHVDFPSASLDQPINDKDLDTAYANAAARLSKDVNSVTLDDLDPASKTDGGDCPDTADGVPNMCSLDVVAIQSSNANYTNTDNGGLGGGN